MIRALLAYGMFVFGMHTLAYDQLQRQMRWRHPTASRVGERPASQFLGPDVETITLTGTLYPEIAGKRLSLDIIEAMGNSGKAWPLIDGEGHIYGAYTLVSVDHTNTAFFPDGAPRKIDFAITLQRAEDPDLLGTIDAILLRLI